VLAHAEDDVARIGIGIRAGRAQPVTLGDRGVEEKAHSSGGRRIGGGAERASDGHDGPRAAQIRERHEQGHLGLVLAQNAHGIRRCRRRKHIRIERAAEFGHV
jgi:hypothetical protein